MPRPLPVIPGIFRVVINWQAGTQYAKNVLHVRASVGWPTTFIRDIVDSIPDGAFNTVADPAVAPDCDITPLDGVSTTHTYALASWAGSSGTTEYIPGAPFVVGLKTNVRGRSYRGRIFLPFTAESKQSQGQLSVASHPALEALWNDWVDGIPPMGSDAHLVVASYKHATAEDVVHADFGITCKTMKRRINRVT